MKIAVVRYFIVITAITMVAGCGKGKKEAPKSEVLARFNGKVITMAQFNEEQAKLSPDIKATLGTAEGKKKFLETLVNKELLIAEAEKLGMGNDPSVAAKLEEIKKTLIIEAFLKKEIEEKAVFTEKEAEAYYNSHKDEIEGEPFEKIKDKMTKKKQKDLFEGLVNSLKKEAKIEIDDAMLGKYAEKEDNTGIQKGQAIGASATADSETQGAETALDWFLFPKGTKKVFELRLSNEDKEPAGNSVDLITEIKADQFGDKLISLVSKRSLGSLRWTQYYRYKLNNSEVVLIEQNAHGITNSMESVIMLFPFIVGTEWQYLERIKNIYGTSTNELHKRKIVGKEKISTSAGDFDCIVISDEVAGVLQYDYYAKGVGLVAEKLVLTSGEWHWMKKLVKISMGK